jgi:Capsule assembly protein Wzi
MPSSSLRLLPLLLAAALAGPQTVHAQWQSNTGPSGAALGVTVGSDVERYVRALILAGHVGPVPWGTRPLGADDLRELLRADTTGAHPWRGQLHQTVRRRASVAMISATSVNSGFAWGSNDGAQWQGRGMNASLGAAATFRWGPLTAVAAPIAFVAQNSAFPLLPPPVLSASPYADGLFPTIVDNPQRMGNGAYARVHAGESSLRLRAGGLDVGISTASLGWGTGEAFPSIFGANAGGFPHVFAGTSGRGLRIPFIGRLSTRYVLGTLQQSDWSSVQGSETYIDRDQSGTSRIGVGIGASFLPAFLPNLELGASRFYHSPYRDRPERWSAWTKPFENVFKKSFEGRTGGPGDEGGDNDNQLGAFFARWTFPRRGVEAALEIFREDHNWDSRDLAQEPENNSAVLASLRAVTHRSADRLSVLTFEYFDGDIRPIAQVRAQGYLYSHGYLRQGHTQRGQLLGSPIGAGAIAGERVAWERFAPNGSLRANVQRWRTRSAWTSDPEALFRAPNASVPKSHDWILDASLAVTRYRHGRALTVEGGIAWAGQFNFDESRTNLYSRASWSLF